jgi:hypothetical protein
MMRHILVSIALSSSVAVAVPSLPAPTKTTTTWLGIRTDHYPPTTTEPHHRRAASPAPVLALTTTFIPSAACLSEIYIVVVDTTKKYYASLGTPNTADCFPQGWRPDPTMYFSPGICPSGYRVACTNVGNTGSLYETTATCCPR